MSSSNANFKVFETMIVKKNCITPVLHLNMLIWPLWQFCTFIKLHPILMKYYFNNVIFKWHPLFTDLNKILYMSLFHQKCVSAFCRKFSRYKNVFNITKMCFFWDKMSQKNPVFFWILGSNQGGLNQNSACNVICEIHIYMDSESFRQIHWKM